MDKFKVGDIVARRSYNYDVLFRITDINNGIAELVGISVRIVADAPEYDLKHISKEEADKMISNLERSRHARLNRCYSNMNRKYINMHEKKIMDINPNIYTKDKVLKKPGIILHIDGDSEYAAKSREIYKNMGITAYTYNIAESEQYKQIYPLLQKIRPNILILTGHDAFIRRRNDIYNIDNYKNSKYYIQGVLEARRYEHNLDNLVIFAGACQSYYEAIITARSKFCKCTKKSPYRYDGSINSCTNNSIYTC